MWYINEGEDVQFLFFLFMIMASYDRWIRSRGIIFHKHGFMMFRVWYSCKWEHVKRREHVESGLWWDIISVSHADSIRTE